MAIGLYYPKPRDLLTKIIPIRRTDSSTLKAVLPKDAIVTAVLVQQTSAAVTAAASFNLGWSGATTALVNGFSMPTTSVGLTTVGAAAGSAVGTKLDSDKYVIATFVPGTSTAGGEGNVIIQYFMPGAGEGIYD